VGLCGRSRILEEWCGVGRTGEALREPVEDCARDSITTIPQTHEMCMIEEPTSPPPFSFPNVQTLRNLHALRPSPRMIERHMWRWGRVYMHFNRCTRGSSWAVVVLFEVSGVRSGWERGAGSYDLDVLRAL
jgi:hypothetical protein